MKTGAEGIGLAAPVPSTDFGGGRAKIFRQRHAENLAAIRTPIPFGGRDWGVGSASVPEFFQLWQIAACPHGARVWSEGNQTMKCEPPFAREESREKPAKAIVQLLNGFTLGGAISALREAEHLLLLPHFVDAKSALAASDERWKWAAQSTRELVEAISPGE
jgi:hypothetical protein